MPLLGWLEKTKPVPNSIADDVLSKKKGGATDQEVDVMRLNFEPTGIISTTYSGTRNGMSVRLQTFFDTRGQEWMRFPFTIDDMH